MKKAEEAKMNEFISNVYGFVEDNVDKLYDLKSRWEDEQQYEDFKDYKTVIIKLAEKRGIKPSRITKNFTISFKFNKTHWFVINLLDNGEAEITLNTRLI